MNKGFAIIFDNTLGKENLEEFFEVIRSSYVSKKGNTNIFIVSTPQETTAATVFNTIKSKLMFNTSFFVIRLDNFYGNLPKEVFDWIKDAFPDIKLLSDKIETPS